MRTGFMQGGQAPAFAKASAWQALLTFGQVLLRADYVIARLRLTKIGDESFDVAVFAAFRFNG